MKKGIVVRIGVKATAWCIAITEPFILYIRNASKRQKEIEKRLWKMSFEELSKDDSTTTVAKKPSPMMKLTRSKKGENNVF